MKKLLVILMAVLIPAISFAQRGIPRSNNVSVSVKRVTETTKEPKTYNARVGFQQMASFNLGLYEFECLGLGMSYVGGYRFDDVLFLGGGLEINTDVDCSFMEEYYIPIYAQLRTYFTKRIWRPYISLSIGGHVGSVYISEGYEYLAGFYADFSVGADARVSESLNVFMALGLNNRGVQLKAGLSF